METGCELSSTGTDNSPPPESSQIVKLEPPTKAPVTWLYVLVCVAIYLGLLIVNDYESPETLAKFGFVHADQIWGGAWWGLVSPAAVHFDLWHIALNVYWIWVLGRVLETSIGSWRYLAFLISSAAISSSYQLAVSDMTGIGASGVVYAIFGFMAITRQRYPEFQAVLPGNVIQLFNTWLVLCFVLTYLNIMSIGNAAHLSGLLFGAGVGWVVLREAYWRAAALGVVMLILGAFIPLFWMPWSTHWQRYQAYRLHADGQYEAAVRHYDVLIQRDREDSWAYYNRAGAFEALKEPIQAREDMKRALELNPSLGEEKK